MSVAGCEFEAIGQTNLATVPAARLLSAPGLLAPGRNCWRVVPASRAALLVDAAEYYARLEQALRAAQRSIIIVGWDFDASIRLGGGSGPGETLGDLLRSLVERRPELQLRILIWDFSTIHGPGATLPMLFGDRWQEHERIALKLDSEHPFYGAQHAKLVVIDDSIAFAGGIDLTVNRWDTTGHAQEDACRVCNGVPYAPVHDMQMLVEGHAAAALGEFARARWRKVTGEAVASAEACTAAWPADLAPDFSEVRVAIARTSPRWRRRPGAEEAAQLAYDALKAARRSIYIEAQYLTDFRAGAILAAQLERADGPEVVILATREMHSGLEKYLMGENRDRLIRRLVRADRHGRLRVFHPVVPGPNGDCSILIHSKLLIVDDLLLKVGSANLNNRSTGLDVECDLAVEGESGRAQRAIAAIRARLLAEHLCAEPEEVEQAIAQEGSLVRAIDRLNTHSRCLRAYHVAPEGPRRPVFLTRILDPRKPFPVLSWFRGRQRRRRAFNSAFLASRGVRGQS